MAKELNPEELSRKIFTFTMVGVAAIIAVILIFVL